MATSEPTSSSGGDGVDDDVALVTTEAYQSLDPRVRRRLVLAVVLRAVGVTAALTIGYVLLPVSADGTNTGLSVLVVGITVLVVVVIRQLQQILAAEHPQLRAVVAVATVVPLFVFVFAYVYVWLSSIDPANFTESIGRLDGVYFVVTVFTTVGFGDITPVTSTARAVVTLQMVLDLVLIGVVAKLIVGASRVGVRRRRAEAAASRSDGGADAEFEADPDAGR